MLHDELNDWLTNAGDVVVRMKAVDGLDSLQPHERLLYEVWLFDTEQRNGGVSQYFCNWGREQWDSLCASASPNVPSFLSFAVKVNSVIGCHSDPYDAIIESGDCLDTAYQQNANQIISELQTIVARQHFSEDPQ
jgi:hypothetical protein